MNAMQTVKDASNALTIRQHFNNCRHCFNVDGTMMEFVEWAANLDYTLEEMAQMLNTQVWELVPACDIEDVISDGWVEYILLHFDCSNIYLVQTCRL